MSSCGHHDDKRNSQRRSDTVWMLIMVIVESTTVLPTEYFSAFEGHGTMAAPTDPIRNPTAPTAASCVSFQGRERNNRRITPLTRMPSAAPEIASRRRSKHTNAKELPG